MIACLVILPSGHHLASVVVHAIDDKTVGDALEASFPAGVEVDRGSDVRHREPGQGLVDLTGVGVCPVHWIGAPGCVHGAYGHIGGDCELGIVVHGRSGGIDAYGTEITSHSCHGVAHSHGAGCAVIVVLAESQSIVHCLCSRCDSGQQECYSDKCLFHFDRILIV